MNIPSSFTALDFETLTAERSSACAIGLVKVADGVIVQRFYSLINPIPDDRTSDNSSVHGITRSMVANAPTFLQLWPTIQKFIGEDFIVSHNAEFDSSVWRYQLTHYDCGVSPDDFQFLCSYVLTGQSLDEACARLGIDMGVHHDALDDALACAKVVLAEIGHIFANVFKGGVTKALEQKDKRKYERATLDPLADEQVDNQSTPFFHARTVITGVFSAYPNRNDLGKTSPVAGC